MTAAKHGAMNIKLESIISNIHSVFVSLFIIIYLYIKS